MGNFVDSNELADFLEVDGIDLFDNPEARCLFFSKKWCDGSISISFVEYENNSSISYEINGKDFFRARIDDVLDIKNHGGDLEVVSSRMGNLVLSKRNKGFLLTFNV